MIMDTLDETVTWILTIVRAGKKSPPFQNVVHRENFRGDRSSVRKWPNDVSLTSHYTMTSWKIMYILQTKSRETVHV